MISAKHCLSKLSFFGMTNWRSWEKLQKHRGRRGLSSSRLLPTQRNATQPRWESEPWQSTMGSDGKAKAHSKRHERRKLIWFVVTATKLNLLPIFKKIFVHFFVWSLNGDGGGGVTVSFRSSTVNKRQQKVSWDKLPIK